MTNAPPSLEIDTNFRDQNVSTAGDSPSVSQLSEKEIMEAARLAGEKKRKETGEESSYDTLMNIGCREIPRSEMIFNAFRGEPRLIGLPLGLLFSYAVDLTDAQSFRYLLAAFFGMVAIELFLLGFCYLRVSRSTDTRGIWVPISLFPAVRLRHMYSRASLYEKTSYDVYEKTNVLDAIKQCIGTAILMGCLSWRFKVHVLYLIQIFTAPFAWMELPILHKYIFNSKKRVFLELTNDPNDYLLDSDGKAVTTPLTFGDLVELDLAEKSSNSDDKQKSKAKKLQDKEAKKVTQKESKKSK